MLWLLACTSTPPAEEPIGADAGSTAPPSAPGAGLQLATSHLPTVALELEAKDPTGTDWSRTFYSTDLASAHMHLISRDQMCPLHIHRVTNEATIVLSGSPDVLQVWSEDGEQVDAQARMQAGAMVASPPFTGHEWDNNSQELQANLVLAYPPFDGNLYMRPGDARMDAGTEPFDYHPDADVDAFVSSEAPFDRKDLPALDDHISRVFVADSYTLPASTDAHAVIYAVSGEGQLIATDLEQGVRPGMLLVFQRPEDVTFRASSEAPLTLYVFEPPIKG